LAAKTTQEPRDTEVGFELEQSRQWLADSINDLSGSLDSFFVNTFFGEQITEEERTGSTGRLAIFSRRELDAHSKVDVKFEGRLKLELPYTNKRAKILFQSEDDSGYTLNRDPEKSVEKASYFTSLRLLLKDSDSWSSDFDLGVHWDLPPDPFVRLRAKKQVDFAQVSVRAVQSVFYYVIDGLGEKTELQFDRPIDEKRLFRIGAEARYMQNNAYFNLDYALSLYSKMPHNAMLVANLGAKGDTEQGAVFKEYFVSLKYRRLIYKDWIYIESTPQLEWNADRNYLLLPVIMFRIEAMIE
jgi:hypothetical protein